VEQIPDDSAHSADLQRLREEWQRRTDRPAPAASSLDGLKDGFARLQIERDEQEKRLERLQQKLIERDRNLQGLERQRLDAAGALADADRRMAELLQQLGAGSRDEYLAALARYEAAEALAGRLAAELERLAGERKPAEHRTELERRLKIFDEEGVGEEALPDAERARLVGDLRKLQGEREILETELGKLEQERARLAGEMQGSMEPIAREIVELDQRRLRLAERLDQLKLDREAAKLAINALRTLENDANAMLETLALDLQESFTRIIPDARDLRFLKPSLDFGNIVVHDAAGTARPLEALSTGTRDSFVFAARLALALRSSPGGAQLIALDEPFLTLDAARERNCLEYLRAFQEEHGWQVVLLTKEERLRDAAGELLKDVRVHEL
jgi:DNA repair exonuclease SbcCD ATPase subunit